MKKAVSNKKVRKSTKKNPMPKGIKTSRVKNKKAIPSKKPPKAVKKTAVKKPSKTVKPVKKTAKKSVKQKTVKKTAEKNPDAAQKIKVPVPEPKPLPSLQDLSLPDGNDYKQTAHRRPLIVFPK